MSIQFSVFIKLSHNNFQASLQNAFGYDDYRHIRLLWGTYGNSTVLNIQIFRFNPIYLNELFLAIGPTQSRYTYCE